MISPTSHGSEAGPAEAYRSAFHRRQLGTGRRSSKIPGAAAWGQLVFLRRSQGAAEKPGMAMVWPWLLVKKTAI